MSNSVRAWLLLVVTLCLGIAIGVLGAGAMQGRRALRVSDMRRPGGFIENVQEVIQPVSDSQWNLIRPIVEATAQENASRRRMHDSTMRSSLESLKAQLAPLLNDAQRDRLARFAPPRRDGPPDGPRRRRPPRDGDGPPPHRDDGPPGDDDRRGPPPPRPDDPRP